MGSAYYKVFKLKSLVQLKTEMGGTVTPKYAVAAISIGFSNSAFLFPIYMYFYTHNMGLSCG